MASRGFLVDSDRRGGRRGRQCARASPDRRVRQSLRAPLHRRRWRPTISALSSGCDRRPSAPAVLGKTLVVGGMTDERHQPRSGLGRARRARRRKAIISRRPNRSSTGRCARSSMTICSACSTSRAIATAARAGAGRPLFHQDTRFLSGLSICSSAAWTRCCSARSCSTTMARWWSISPMPTFHGADGQVWLQRDSIHCRADQIPLRHRPCLRTDQACARFGPVGCRSRSNSLFDADFADLFEVRGDRRPRRGTLHRRGDRPPDGALPLCRSRWRSSAPPRIAFRSGARPARPRTARWALDLDASAGADRC